jgi:ribosome biogenesis GTPase
MSSETTGIVFKSTGSWYNVQVESGEFLKCRPRGKLKLSEVKTTNPVAVGDKVIVVPDIHHPGTGIIQEILPRENFVVRKSVHKTEHGHLLAANIDQAIILVTISHPKTSFGFIDRFLVSTEAYRIPTIILINKTDLHSVHDNVLMESLIDTYELIGVRCFPISIIEKKGLDVIHKLVKNKLTLIAGHSGTGKSTLMNSLHIDIDQKIGRVSEFANKGIHTTTFAEMFPLDDKTFVIDTPGIKELGLIDIGDHELSDYFPEMRALLGECKFHNCSHTHEPKCAIIEAVENGHIAMSRFLSYLSMLENEDTRR